MVGITRTERTRELRREVDERLSDNIEQLISQEAKAQMLCKPGQTVLLEHKKQKKRTRDESYNIVCYVPLSSEPNGFRVGEFSCILYKIIIPRGLVNC